MFIDDEFGITVGQCSLIQPSQINVPGQENGPGYLETPTSPHFEHLFIILDKIFLFLLHHLPFDNVFILNSYILLISSLNDMAMCL